MIFWVQWVQHNHNWCTSLTNGIIPIQLNVVFIVRFFIQLVISEFEHNAGRDANPKPDRNQTGQNLWLTPAIWFNNWWRCTEGMVGLGRTTPQISWKDLGWRSLGDVRFLENNQEFLQDNVLLLLARTFASLEGGTSTISMFCNLQSCIPWISERKKYHPTFFGRWSVCEWNGWFIYIYISRLVTKINSRFAYLATMRW